MIVLARVKAEYVIEPQLSGIGIRYVFLIPCTAGFMVGLSSGCMAACLWA